MNKKLTSMKELLKKAYSGGYAVGAFNFSSIEVMRSIVDAAQNVKSPVILALSEKGLRYADPAYLVKVVDAALEKVDIPICLHLDHGKNLDIVKECIDAGFNSVMIDGSYLPYEENVKLTKQVVEYAHARGVDVEGELGVLAGVEDDVSSDVTHFTDPVQAKEFVERTGVDSLAIAIGTSHGAFKFKGEAKIRFDILDEITKLLPDFPVVLHGASHIDPKTIEKINGYGGDMQGAKGMPDDMIKRAAKGAVCKINIDTELRVTFTAAIREYLHNNPKEYSPRQYLQYAKDAVRETVEFKMRNVLKSAGKGTA